MQPDRSASVLIGLDGGGTKTTAVLCSREGNVLAHDRVGGTAVVGLPPQSVCTALNEIVARLCGTVGVARSAILHVALGMSGIDFDDEVPLQHGALCNELGLDPTALTLVNDAVTALWGVAPDHRLALIQHGTGLTSAYRAEPGGETVFDSLDIALQYDVRRSAFAETARMIDGRTPRTPLADRMLAHCGVTADSFAEWAFRCRGEARHSRASCARVVFEAWQEGDSVADDIVERAAADYAVTIRAMGDRLGQAAFSVGLGGGVVAQGGVPLLHRVAEKLAMVCPLGRLVPVGLPPEAGAVVLASYRTGGDWMRLFDSLRLQFSPGVGT